MIEMSEEGCRVSAFCPSRHQSAGVPGEGADQMPFLFVAWCLDGRLLSLSHPHGANLGICADLGFILEEGDLVAG